MSSSWPGQVLSGIEGDFAWVRRPELEAIRVTGPDRQSWLHGVLTHDVLSLRPGIAGWGLSLNKPGKIQAEVWTLAGEEELLLFTPAGQSADLLASLDHFLIMEDAEQEPCPEVELVMLIGPGAAGAVAGLSARAFGELDFLGFGGALAAVPRGAELSLSLTSELSPERYAELRVERWLPEWGADYGPESNPHEASLAHRQLGAQPIDWQKGCYLGQEVVCMQDLRGKVRRALFPVAIDAAEPPAAGAEVRAGEQVVGELRSARVSAALGPVGFALLKTAALEGPLTVDGAPLRVLRR
ncbi:MAG: hypothetical protein KIT72_10470 [Polyangiaceae bacterium]|nr:hypothetical protein [Polyangiaceae bacterium]MCW5790836.1 hypothetical protein [Polyangiaceae bacterium]